MCAGYDRKAHEVPATIQTPKKKRANNAIVDHINPVVDPVDGHQGWDIYINRLFCETDNLQVLCKKCHDAKTLVEKHIRKKSK